MIRNRLANLLAFAVVVVVAGIAYADSTSGPGSSTPQTDIVDQSGRANAKQFSNDAQIAQLSIDSTGVTATTTGLTVFKDGTHMVPLEIRGAITANATQGTLALAKSGWYRAHFNASCTGTTADANVVQLATTTDDLSYTSLTQGKASFASLTGILTLPISVEAYFLVSSAQAAAGTFHLVVLGSNSAHTTTCASGLLAVERVNPVLPPAVP